MEQGTCVAARRDRPGKEGKQFGIPLDPQGFVGAVEKLLEEVQVCRTAKHRFTSYNIDATSPAVTNTESEGLPTCETDSSNCSTGVHTVSGISKGSAVSSSPGQKHGCVPMDSHHGMRALYHVLEVYNHPGTCCWCRRGC